MKKEIIPLICFMSFICLTSCTQFLKTADESYFDELSPSNKKKELQILFSHNINGETHPCGCRNYPLGGIPQVAGQMYDIHKNFPAIYIDTGDTFFPSTSIPESVHQSLTFKAKEIAYALKKMGLTFYVPGDQDFALGENFLKDLVNDFDIPVLVSNFSKSAKIKHKSWDEIQFGEQHLFFIGVVDPIVLPSQYRKLFSSPSKGIRKVLQKIESEYSHVKNKKIILLSHSGIDRDQSYAREFPQLDWIIGAHSQSFLRYTIDVGKTRLAQTLSRNHYLGNITIAPSPSVKDKYQIIEIRNQLEQKWKENPFTPWLVDHKKKLDQIQLQEQDLLTVESTNQKIPTASSCIDCHTSQTDFWKKTAHAISYQTLVINQEQNNTACIGCHSLGFKDSKAFVATKHVVQFSNENENESDKNTKKIHDQRLDAYLKELSTHFKDIKSIRALTKEKRLGLSNKWFEIDEKHNVEYNYANVQCLNCHSQSLDHPFDDDEDNENTAYTTNYQNKCVSCHTQDQSPEWYDKDKKGIASKLNKEYFAKKLKQISCPKKNE